MLDVIPPPNQQADHGDTIADIQQNNTRSHHAIKRRRAAQVQQPQTPDQERTHPVRRNGYILPPPTPLHPLEQP